MADYTDNKQVGSSLRPRALVFDLYGEYFRYAGGQAKMGALVELLSLFGVEAATVRVVMARLRRDGWFDSVKSGREVTYLLNDKSWRLLDIGWKRIFERHYFDWDRTWTQALIDRSSLTRKRSQRIQTVLTWCGFGKYGNDIWFSPHDRVKQVRDMAEADDDMYIRFLSCRSVDVANDRLISEQCWDLSELNDEYQSFIEQYKPRLARYRCGMDGEAALIERMKLIQRYRLYPFRDPDLPEVLLPPTWRGQVAHELFVECHQALRRASDEWVGTIMARHGGTCDKNIDDVNNYVA